MAAAKYIVQEFNSSLAAQGALCAMVKTTVLPGTVISTSDPNLMGIGICEYSTNRYSIKISNTAYYFYDDGSCASDNAANYKLMLAKTTAEVSDIGSAVKTDSTTIITRQVDGSISYTEADGKSVVVNELEARDQFAIYALKTLMERMKSDPAVVGDNEKMYICEAAYKWAANMMTQASKTRATITTDEGGGNPKTEDTTKTIDIDDSDISSASDKLLNNIIAALERTDIIDRLRGVWKKGDTEISGYYSDRGAWNATGYKTIAAALAAGWSFKAGGYNEATEIVHFTELTDLIKAYNKATSTQATDDEIEPLIDVNEEVEPGGVANKYWSIEAIIKLLRRLQMKKTLSGSDDAAEYGAAAGNELYLQRIVNPRQNELIKDFLKNEDSAQNAKSVRLKEFLLLYKKFLKHSSTGGEDTQDVIALEEFLNLMKAYVSHTPTEEEDTQDTVGLDDLIKAIKAIRPSTTVNVDLTELIAAITAMGSSRTISGNISVNNLTDITGTINIGDNGIGRDSAHPLYISGGGFPTRQSLAASIAADSIHDLLTFNEPGGVGYSPLTEVKKAVLGYLNGYADLNALYVALQPSIDNRIREWLQAARDAEGRSLTINTPT